MKVNLFLGRWNFHWLLGFYSGVWVNVVMMSSSPYTFCFTTLGEFFINCTPARYPSRFEVRYLEQSLPIMNGTETLQK